MPTCSWPPTAERWPEGARQARVAATRRGEGKIRALVEGVPGVTPALRVGAGGRRIDQPWRVGMRCPAPPDASGSPAAPVKWDGIIFEAVAGQRNTLRPTISHVITLAHLPTYVMAVCFYSTGSSHLVWHPSTHHR
ncbi:unnamed protein product, partial [Ectocarpus sp. 13 AM-2016]